MAIAVSGGPDSVALLHVLHALQGEDIFCISAVIYINHGLRPKEAEQEEALVRSLCLTLEMPFIAKEVPVHAYARSNRLSLEHAARELRYRALRQIAADCGGDVICVAHTADDQAEEILIRLLRGSGRKGLSGMRAREGDIVRPLLRVDKKRILQYLRDKHISYSIDSSNRDMRFLRNRVRHRLIPYLERNFERGVRRALCKTADSLADDEKLLEELTDKSFDDVVHIPTGNDEETGLRMELDRGKFRDLPGALQRRVIEKLLWRIYSRASYSHITKIVDAAINGRTGTELHLSRGLRAGVQQDYLEFLYPEGKLSWRGRLYQDR